MLEKAHHLRKRLVIKLKCNKPRLKGTLFTMNGESIGPPGLFSTRAFHTQIYLFKTEIRLVRINALLGILGK